MLRPVARTRLTHVVQHFSSFGSQPSQTPSRPAWWGDRLSLFPNADAAVEAAYELYADSFSYIRETSIIRAHLERHEFNAVLDASSSYNIGVFDDERLVGICSIDTDVATNAALNPIALQRRYPDQFSRAAVYYCWFIATRDGSRSEAAVLSHVLEAIAELVAERRGCVVFDVLGSGGKLEPQKRARALEALGSRFSTTRVDPIDAEYYYAIHVSPKDEPVIDLVQAEAATLDATSPSSADTVV